MMARMLHPPLDKNKLHNKKSAQSVKKHMTEYEIDNKSVYDILYQITRTLLCIHVSNSISPRGTVEGPSTPGG